MAEVTPYDPTPELQTNVLGPEDSIPNTPFGFPLSYREMQGALNRGEITRKDIETVRKSARWMQGGMILGAAAGIPLYFTLRRARPLSPAIFPFLISGMTMYAGSVGGFTLGAFAAIPWMRKRMDNGEQKIRVFRQLIRNEVADEIVRDADRGREFAAKLKGDLKAEENKGRPA